MGCFNAGGTADIIEIVRPGIREKYSGTFFIYLKVKDGKGEWNGLCNRSKEKRGFGNCRD